MKSTKLKVPVIKSSKIEICALKKIFFDMPVEIKWIWELYFQRSNSLDSDWGSEPPFSQSAFCSRLALQTDILCGPLDRWLRSTRWRKAEPPKEQFDSWVEKKNRVLEQ